MIGKCRSYVEKVEENRVVLSAKNTLSDIIMRVALARSIEPNIDTLVRRTRRQVSSRNFIFFSLQIFT